MKFSRLLLSIVAAGALIAHPMGNFSVSHYTKISVGARGAELLYVLDLAEIPTLEILQNWKLDRSSPREQLERKAAEQAREWTGRLKITANGRAVTAQFQGADLAIADGAGGLPVARIATRLRLPVNAGKLEFEDRNYPNRAGWKEIVIAPGNGATIERATQDDRDRSQALRAYPQDPQVAPPQDLRAAVEWSAEIAPAVAAKKHEPVIAPIPQPRPAMAKAESLTPQQQNAPGAVAPGDRLSKMLQNRELSLGMALVGIAAAFGLGAFHALSPGHGKTIVAAYLVGSRGTPRHAIFLGGMVTFTHTVSVFALGFTTLFLSRYVAPDKISPVLEVISSIAIVWIGAMLLYKRLRALMGHSQPHDHHHHHEHGEHHHHDHDHGPHGHSHVPEGDVTLGSLIALGASGGLVPCPSGLILLLAAIRFDRLGLGLLLLVAFSMGLAAVLTAIGLAVIYAKDLIPDTEKARSHFLFRLIPVLSAGVVLCIGLVMTGISLGVIS